MRTALVHDWLTGLRGGERCLEALLPLFPDAPVYTLFHHRGSVGGSIETRPIRTSPLQGWPIPASRYRWMLPFFPWAASRLDLEEYDRVISISHCAAKGVISGRGTIHISYCLTPMRYAWDMASAHWMGSGLPSPASPPAALLRAWLQAWDRDSSRRVTHFVAISRFVAERIRRAYGREADVIPPPVDCHSFRPSGAPDRFFLVVAALTPYKRVEDAVIACRRLGLPLLVVGEGPQRHRIERVAGPRAELLGRVGEETLRRLYASCRALIFPGVEDFGLAPVEAMASGRPVIGLGKGGILDSVVSLNGSARGPTGILYGAPGPDALEEALRRFLKSEGRFEPEVCRRRALEFDRSRFQERFSRMLDGVTERGRSRC